MKNPYQIEQTEKLAERYNHDLTLDENLFEDDMFEFWDNIATDEYQQRGGVMVEGLHPEDESLFENCQDYTNDMILERVGHSI